MFLHKDVTEYVIVLCQLSVCYQHVSFNKQGSFVVLQMVCIVVTMVLLTVHFVVTMVLQTVCIVVTVVLHCGHHGAPEGLH